jgi:hypothetical protein
MRPRCARVPPTEKPRGRLWYPDRPWPIEARHGPPNQGMQCVIGARWCAQHADRLRWCPVGGPESGVPPGCMRDGAARPPPLLCIDAAISRTLNMLARARACQPQ